VTTMPRLYVLDTGALLSTWTRKNPDSDFVTIPAVLSELQNRPSQRRAETLISAGRLKEEVPESLHIAKVKEIARSTGDLHALSDNDIQLLALALSKKESGFTVVVVSSDMSLLNTASFIGLTVVDLGSRMSHQVTWGLRCPACGHTENRAGDELECPVCGTVMRRWAANKRRVA